mgnify:CR=1 FL=1
MEDLRIQQGTLQQGDIVFCKTFGGCALISEYVHSYDVSFRCDYIWYPKEHRFWIDESVSLDDIRKPTWEEVCEFTRQYLSLSYDWCIEYEELKQKIGELINK